MDIRKSDRPTLKSYFVKNAVPTEANFADLIEGLVNQKEDGIAKLPGEPLSIQADGTDASQKKAINFYKNFADVKPAWSLSLNPRADPNNPATARPGWSIGDADGNSRLFIDQSTGNVGIGTIDPGASRLRVNGPALVSGNNLHVSAENAGRLRVGSAWNMPGLYSSDDGPRPLVLGVDSGQKVYFGVSNSDAYVEGGSGNAYFKGRVGIGTTTPASPLHVHGTSGDFSLTLTNSANTAGRRGYRIAFDNDRFMFQRAGDAGGFVGHHVAIMQDSGSVGIGTTTPAEALDVNGRVKAGGMTIGPWPANPAYMMVGANSLNQAAPENYALLQGTGDGPGRTFLNSPVDIRFRIANGDRMTIANNGSVGIGTTAPADSLHVEGNIRANNLHVYGHLNKLDVLDEGFAYIRAHDLWFGHSGRRGSAGRALVDEGQFLTLNFAGDWVQGVRYWGNLTRMSSRTLKHRIRKLSSRRARRIVDELEPVTFVYNFDRSCRPALGFIAEDAPHDVAAPDRRGVRDDHILAALTRVVKDQQERLGALAAQLASLRRVTRSTTGHRQGLEPPDSGTSR